MRDTLKQLAIPLLIALALTGLMIYVGLGPSALINGERDCAARRETLGRPVGNACPEWTDAGVVGR